MDSARLAEAATQQLINHLNRTGLVTPDARDAQAMAGLDRLAAVLLKQLVLRDQQGQSTLQSALDGLIGSDETFKDQLEKLITGSSEDGPFAGTRVEGSGPVSGRDVDIRGVNVAGRDFIKVVVGNPPPVPAELVQLPPDITEFTGREEIVADLVSQLQEAERRSTPVIISAIAGKAGVGKTALAIHVAHRAGRSFPDGRLYVDLRGNDPDPLQRLSTADVLARFLGDLGVEGAHLPDDIQARTGLYRARLAYRQFLVVLDNAYSVAQVRPLLPGSPGCAVLITSRRRFRTLAGARHVNLDVLPPEEAVRLLGEIAGSDRISAEPRQAEELAAYSGYLPLALRILGARLAGRPTEQLSQLCDRLRHSRDRLNQLTIDDLEVRASFGLSYGELPDNARRAFRMLGLLRIPSFPVWVAAALLGDTLHSAEKLVNLLVDAQLVEDAGTDVAGQTRYRLHDLLRLFAGERLEAEEPQEAQQAALERARYGTLSLAIEADVAIQPGSRRRPMPKKSNAWPTSPLRLATVDVNDPLAWFTAERANLIIAAERARSAQVWPFVWELTASLPAFFELRAHWAEWENTSELALDAARHLHSESRLAQSQRSRGDLRREQGRFEEAIELLHACLQTLPKGQKREKAAAMRSLGNVYRQQFKWTEAYEHFAACLEIYKQLGDRRGAALSQHDLGIALRNQGHWDDAIVQFKECLGVFHELDDRRSEAYVLRSLAVAYRNQGRWKEARDHIQQCLPIFKAIGDRRGWAYALAPLSDVFRDDVLRDEEGRYDMALKLLDKCLQIRGELGDRRWKAATERSIGVIYRLQGRPTAAESMLNNCLIAFRELRDKRLEAYTLTGLGEVYGDVGRIEEALANFDSSLRVLIPLGDRLWVAKTLLSRGEVLSADPALDPLRATEDLAKAHGIFTALGAPEAQQTGHLLAKL